MIAGGILVIVMAWVLQRRSCATKWRNIDPRELDKTRMKQTTDLKPQAHKPINRNSGTRCMDKGKLKKILVGEFTIKRVCCSLVSIYVCIACFAYFYADWMIFLPHLDN